MREGVVRAMGFEGGLLLGFLLTYAVMAIASVREHNRLVDERNEAQGDVRRLSSLLELARGDNDKT